MPFSGDKLHLTISAITSYSGGMDNPKKKNKSDQSVLDAISELAQAVGLGFEKVDKRFDHVEKRLDDLQDQI